MFSNRSNKQNSGRKRKRIPPKNRYVKNVCAAEGTISDSPSVDCSSAKKLNICVNLNKEKDNDDYFILLNFSTLKSMITLTHAVLP